MSAPLRHDANLPGPGNVASADKKPRHLTVVREGYGPARTPEPLPQRHRSPDLFPVAITGTIGAVGAAGLLTYLLGPVTLSALLIVVAFLVVAHAATARGDSHSGRWGR